ncbi:MAG: methylmalonyl-CoA mutase [Bdellovibrionales bacterium]|nr:methylmalonyl-CoA mutase [Bdellovibrionales bacterium]
MSIKNKEDFYSKRSDGTEKEAYDKTGQDFSYEKELGFPGTFPYTRGVQSTMYRGRLWTMRQYSGFGDAAQTNQRFHLLLKAGQTGLSTAFDLPTQMGLDADDPMAQGEVGRVGVSISTVQDMETLFENIPLDQVSTSMTINSTASILLCFYMAAAQKQGVDSKKLRGTLQNDILKEYIARGTYIYPAHPSMKLVSDIIEYCNQNVPQFNPISISGYHIREAGSDAVQELAFTFSNAIAYARACESRGMKFDDFAPRLSFFFNGHNDFIEEIAKFRAARKLWAKISTEIFGSKNPKAQSLRFHTQTAGSSLTAQQSDNNIVRVAMQALAAVLGGTQSLHTNSRDEALGLPTDESAKIALRTQHILAQEMGVAQTIDPLAGSYTVEKETCRLEQEAWKEIQKIQDMGGSIPAIEKQYFQQAIAERAYQYQQSIETGERKIVGLNAYVDQDKIAAPPILTINPQLEQAQRERLKAYRASRNQEACTEKLSLLGRAAAEGKKNLVPFILQAVHAKATLGEISKTLKEVYGSYQP